MYIQLRKRIARAKRQDSKRRKKRSRLDQKKRMMESIRQQREAKRRDVEKEVAEVKSLLETVEETTKATIYVPGMLRKVKDILREVEVGLVAEEYDKIIGLTSESRELLTKAVNRTRIDVRKKDQARYLYCVIASNEDKTFGEIGLDKSEVYTIPFQDVSAVVSPSPLKDYELNEKNATKHQEVTRRVMDEYTVIPAEFGTVIRDETILKNLMAKSYNAIKECIKLVEGKVELGVKAILRKGQNLTPVEKNESAKHILDSLRGKSELLKNGDLFSDRLLLNASFLVKENLVDEFSTEIERLNEKYADRLALLYSGPWAPHNFVYIKIGAEGMSFKER